MRAQREPFGKAGFAPDFTQSCDIATAGDGVGWEPQNCPANPCVRSLSWHLTAERIFDVMKFR